MVIILGLTGVLGKLITLNATHLVWYRMLIAFIALFIFLAYKKQLFTVSRKDFFGILAVGALVTIHWLCFFQSIKVSTVSIAVVCLATSSLFSALIEPFLFKRRLLLYEVVMGVIVIAALAYVLGTEMKYIDGYMYGILAAFLGTLFTLFNAKYINKVDAAQITMIEMLAGVIIITSIFLFKQDFSIFNTPIISNDLIYLLILGILCTAMVFAWMTEIMRHISPYSLIMAINLEPIYSIILALLIFGDAELMSTSFYIGSSIIIAVVYLESYLKKNKQ
tara:strand:+ start:102 stop:935 length:834 start_codon:yes stop_codon:yes gene_type:complete